MTISTTTFSGTAGASVASLSGWALVSGKADNTVINADGTDAHGTAYTLGQYWNNDYSATVDAESYELAIEIKSNIQFQVGPVGRAQSDGSGYLFTVNEIGERCLYRYNGATIVTLVPQLNTKAVLSVGNHTLKMIITGTGATVSVACYLDGVKLGATYNDTSAGRLTAFGYRGLFNAGAHTDTTGIQIKTLSTTDASVGGSVAFALTGATASDGYIYQRVGTTATVSIAGTYTGSPTSIEARLVDAGTSTPVTGFDWATKVASPSGAAFSFTFASVPQGGMYQLQLRDSAAPATITTPSNSFGVGIRVALIGQSNIETLSIFGTGTPNAKLRIYDRWRNPGVWSQTTTGAGAIALGNALVTAVGGAIPVALIQYAVSGAGLHAGAGLATTTSGGVARHWLDLTASVGTPWHDFTTALGVIGASVEIVVYGQGESDAMTGVSPATYATDLATLFGRIRTLLGAGIKIILPLLGQTNDSMGTAADWDIVRQAQISAAITDTNAYPVSKHDLQCDALSPDMSAASVLVWGSRLAQKLSHLLGYAAYSDGPSVAGVTRISSTVYEIRLTHAGGTDITPSAATQVTAIQVKDGSTVVTPSDFVRYAADKIRFTLASAPSGAVSIIVAYGKVPTAQAGVVKDNSALTLPIVATGSVFAIGIGGAVFIKVAGTYKQADSVHVKVSGVYKQADETHMKQAGTYAPL